MRCHWGIPAWISDREVIRVCVRRVAEWRWNRWFKRFCLRGTHTLFLRSSQWNTKLSIFHTHTHTHMLVFQTWRELYTDFNYIFVPHKPFCVFTFPRRHKLVCLLDTMYVNDDCSILVGSISPLTIVRTWSTSAHTQVCFTLLIRSSNTFQDTDTLFSNQATDIF